MTDLREQLQTTLAGTYTVERELGGGGMSRVFVATETALGRRVVVKVLAPELSGGVSAERFRREVQLAAQLQHPHVVPLLSAGQAGDLLYYTMPFVEGESLRARLARNGALAVPEVVRLLRELSDALGYAHERDVVHRDIKPDNILLSRGHALVADFGVAKALSAAATSPGSVTATSVIVGTPLYMAPEQAAGDPSVDHRADLYALGVVAYELLAGAPPFAGRTPHQLMRAHVAEAPRPLAALCPDAPPGLAALIMRCLAKNPEERPQSAAEVLQALEAVGSDPTLPGTPAPPSRRALGLALAVYAAAFLIVAALARLAIVAIGLPDWVFSGALVVMALGLPVILLTGYVHRAARRTITPAYGPASGRVAAPPPAVGTLARQTRPHLTWRRAALGGVIALGAFALLVAGYMALRALGIGPAGSLIAAGVLRERERILVADFASPRSDTTLGPVVAEAFRTDLAQSPTVTVFPPTALRQALRRMGRPPDARVDFSLAREVATREGIRAVVDGEVVTLGGRYVLSARLVGAQAEEQLGEFRETADAAEDLIPAIGRLSKRMRAKMGESLRGVRRTPPLERVSTGSLEALRMYVAGFGAFRLGDAQQGIALLEQAIDLDTGFAMAYRRLGTELMNRGGQTGRAQALLQKAYDHRDRLTDIERYLTIGTYYSLGPAPDIGKAIAAYEAALDLDSTTSSALNNAADLYRWQRQFGKAEEFLRRRANTAGESGLPLGSIHFTNLFSVQLALGKLGQAERTLERFAQTVPTNPDVSLVRAGLLTVRGRYDSAAALLDSLRAASAFAREGASLSLLELALIRGGLGEARRRGHDWREAQRARGVAHAPLGAALDDAFIDVWFLGDTARALGRVEDGLRLVPLDSIDPIDRPHAYLAELYALAGRADRTKTVLAALERRMATARQLASGHQLGDEDARHRVIGQIALAEGRYPDAVDAFRASDHGWCTVCALPLIARAYDLAGNADSAVAVFARYVETPYWDWPLSDRPPTAALYLAPAHKRLGELYEAKGDRARAASHYAKFVELWQRADPELQPVVADARRRLARLAASERP